MWKMMMKMNKQKILLACANIEAILVDYYDIMQESEMINDELEKIRDEVRNG